MSPDPTEIERLRDQLATLQRLHHAAAVRAGDPPRLGPAAWQGDAYVAYTADADALAVELTSLATDIARVERHARAALAHALA